MSKRIPEYLDRLRNSLTNQMGRRGGFLFIVAIGYIFIGLKVLDDGMNRVAYQHFYQWYAAVWILSGVIAIAGSFVNRWKFDRFAYAQLIAPPIVRIAIVTGSIALARGGVDFSKVFADLGLSLFFWIPLIVWASGVPETRELQDEAVRRDTGEIPIVVNLADVEKAKKAVEKIHDEQ